MTISIGLLFQIIIYSSLTIIIISLLSKTIQSTKIKFNIKNNSKSWFKFKSIYGEPLNLVIMAFLLILVIILINIRVGFEWSGTKGDHPAIILAAIPSSFIFIGLLVNVIQYARGAKKMSKTNSSDMELDIIEKKQLKINYKRKFWHIFAFILVVLVLSFGYLYLKAQIDAGIHWIDHYQRLFDSFFDYTDGTRFIDNIFIRKSPPMGQSFVIIFMYGMMEFLFCIEVTRLSNHVFFLFQKKVQSIMHEKEINTFGSYTHFAVGYFIAAWVLPPFPFLAAFCLVSFADPIASIIGMKFGRHKYSWNKKSYEGTLAGVIISFISMIFFVGWIYALVGSIIFALIDIVTPKLLEVSDNILMPIIITVVFVLLTALGIPYSPLIIL